MSCVFTLQQIGNQLANTSFPKEQPSSSIATLIRFMLNYLTLETNNFTIILFSSYIYLTYKLISMIRKKTLFSACILILCSIACSKTEVSQADYDELGASTATEQQTDTLQIPFAGNAYITQAPTNSAVLITSNGLANWNNAQAVASVYFHVSKKGKLNLGLHAKVSSGSSQAKITIARVSGQNAQLDTVNLQGSNYQNYALKSYEVLDTGFYKVDIQGLTKTSSYFGDVSQLLLSGTASTGKVTYVNNSEFYYYGRRGASTHFHYTLPANKKALYFYNEVYVAPGNDVIGSYFMANGFTGGYLGMQVNSASERRILFSIWSPYKTDDPASIPLEDQIILLRKGTGVTTGTFGNEGSGGQSYLVFPWVAGNTYQFLNKGEPDGNGNTIYTAWFKPSTETQWKLIASWKRPKTDIYLEGVHSFLENFNPNQGYITRAGQYKNQFVYTTDQQWQEVTQARFTSDNTYKKGQRRDVKGGVNASNSFELKINGFFDDYNIPNTNYSRTANGLRPQIDFSLLP